jgi:transposase
MKTRKFVLGNEDEGKTLIGKQDRWQEDIFVACRLSELVPEDHVLKGVNKVLDLSWLRDEVKDLYDEDNGRPGIDPEAAVRLMLAGLYAGITEDRKLMREAQVNIAMRWFAGYRLDERLPDHSSLTRIRQRWGKERFRKIFLRTVAACQEKGLISAETVHIDATLIRADVSWKSLTERHVEKVLEENAGDQEQHGQEGAEGQEVQSDGPGGDDGDVEPQLSSGAELQGAHGGGRQGWGNSGRGGNDGTDKRGQGTSGATGAGGTGDGNQADGSDGGLGIRAFVQLRRS